MNETYTNFYNEINNITDLNSTNNTNDICLISGENINDTSITLDCNHKFNYYYIYKDIVAQKNNFKKNKYAKAIKINQIRCPYCRNVQNTILPYKPIEHCTEKIYGVNYPKKYCMKNSQCPYIFKKGKNKGQQCTKEVLHDFCSLHMKYIKPDKKISLCVPIPT
jgi:hypothetical protein